MKSNIQAAMIDSFIGVGKIYGEGHAFGTKVIINNLSFTLISAKDRRGLSNQILGALT
jgi:hypothetical protein